MPAGAAAGDFCPRAVKGEALSRRPGVSVVYDLAVAEIDDAVAAAPHESNVLVAGPGTGKSYRLEQRVQSLEPGRIVPIYESVGRLNALWFRRPLRRALEQMPE